MKRLFNTALPATCIASVALLSAGLTLKGLHQQEDALSNMRMGPGAGYHQSGDPITAQTVAFRETTASTDSDFPGLVKEKPSDGPFVETDRGYMVPFKMTIPNTDIEYEMIPIPGGTVLMGSPDSEEGHTEMEGPQVSVQVEPFWMGKHEVTWAEYQRFMRLHDIFKRFKDEGIRKITDENRLSAIAAPSNLYDPGFTYDAGDGPKEPAASMTQFAAKQYTKWLSLMTGHFYRLPTEAEWEYACRAGTTTAYSFGDSADDLEEYAWFEDNADWERHDVGSKKPNAFGLFDMHGNVAEWVLDQSYEGGFSHLADKENLTAASAFVQPDETYGRVAKGGMFESTADQCRSASRLISEEEWKDNDPNVPKSPYWYTNYPATGIGFRLMIPLTAPETAEGKESYWKADLAEIQEIVDRRAEAEGRGAIGLVDGDLDKAAAKDDE